MLHTLINRPWLHLRRLQASQCYFACWSVLSCSVLALSCAQFFATPWTAACQAPLSMGLLQARILECIAMPSSRGSSQPRDGTQVSHIAGGFFTDSLQSRQRSPRILEWVAYSFSRGSLQLRNGTRACCFSPRKTIGQPGNGRGKSMRTWTKSSGCRRPIFVEDRI